MRSARDLGKLLVAVGIVGLGIAVVYQGLLATGFVYDDYHFLRPFPPIELRRVWFGSWDPAGIESVFFRPMTVWFFALRFWLLGLNAPLLHAVSAVGQMLCALLVGLFVRRAGLQAGSALFAAGLYAIHPAFPYSQVSWLTNQMHLLESLLVIASLLILQRGRSRPLSTWVCLAAAATVAFLVKEDGIMLFPTLIGVWGLESLLVSRRLPPRFWILVVSGLVLVAALIAARYAQLGQLGGYGHPTGSQLWENLTKGLKSAVFLWPLRGPWRAVAIFVAIAFVLVSAHAVLRGRQKRALRVAIDLAGLLGVGLAAPLLFVTRLEPYPTVTWQAVASGLVVGLALVGGIATLLQPDSRARFIAGAGLIVALLFDLPFAFVSKREQYHLVALGGVLLATGAFDSLTRAALPRKRLAVAFGVILAVPLAMTARQNAADFAPCAPSVVAGDAEARGWWTTPPEIAKWLEVKTVACDAGTRPPPLSAIPAITWGELRDETGPDGYPWTTDRGVIFVQAATNVYYLAFRSPRASPSSPVTVAIDPSGGKALTVRLDSTDWQYATVTWPSDLLRWLRHGERIDFRVDPWFVPALVTPPSFDVRRHGVEYRPAALR